MQISSRLEQNEKLVCEVQGSQACRMKTYVTGLMLMASCVWLLARYPEKIPVLQENSVNPVFVLLVVVITFITVYLLAVYAGISRNRWWISDRRLLFRVGITGTVRDVRLYQVTHIATVENRRGRRGRILLQYREFGDQYLGLQQVSHYTDVARLLRFYRNRARDFGENSDFEVAAG